jgi:hypothetical protein
MFLGNLRDIYTISANGLRGFQEGNPSVKPCRVRLDLFDSADRHYGLIIGTQNDRGPALSQAEVNAIVASLQPVPAT